jgi:hypothetical protein
MLAQGHWSGKLSYKGSIGPHRWWTLQTLCAVRGVPVLCSTNSPLGASASYHPHHVAFLCVAPRHGGAAPTSARGLHASPHGGRQVL